MALDRTVRRIKRGRQHPPAQAAMISAIGR